MKCKKFFALLLSLCMVMSTFVTVANAATETVEVTMYADFNAESDAVVSGPAVSIVQNATVGDDTGVLEITANDSSTWSGQSNTSAWGVAGFAVIDENGDPISRNDIAGWDTLEYSVNVMVPDTTKVASPKFVVRAWKSTDPTPSGTNAAIDNLSGLESGVWKNFEGSIDVADLSWQQTDSMDAPLYFILRANINEAGAKVYMEDLTLTLTKTVEVEDEEEEEVDNSIPFTTQRASTSIVNNGDGSYTLSLVDVSAMSAEAVNDTTGWVRIIPETPIPMDSEFTLTVDVTTDGVADPDDITGFKARLFDSRDGGRMENTLGWLVGDDVPTEDGTITATFTSADFTEDSRAGGSGDIQSITLCYNLSQVYGTTTGSVIFDNITLSTGLPSENEPELPPVTPDGPSDDEDDEEVSDEITFVLSKAVNARTSNGVAVPGVGTLEEDVFTTTMRDVRLYEEARVESAPEGTTSIGSGVGYQPWIWVELDEELDTDEDWYVSFDLTSEGILHSLHAEYNDNTPLADTVRFRFYNGNTEINGSYRPTQTISVNKGEPVNAGCQVDTDMLSQPVTKIGLVVNVGSAIQYNEFIGSDAYFSISNVEVAMGEYVAPEVEEPGDPELPPVEEETEIPHSVARASSIVDVNEDTYTIYAADVAELDRNGLNSYTGYVRVVFDEPMTPDAEWTLTYDLTANGIVSTSPTVGAWLRLFDNETGTTNSNTIGFIKSTADFTDGTRTMTFSSADFEAGGNSTAEEFVSLNITFDFGPVYDAFVDGNEGYIEVSNIRVVEGLPEEEEPELPPVTPDGPSDDEDDDEEITDEVSYIAVTSVVNDFDTEIGDFQVGSNNITGEIVEIGDRTALKATYTGAGASSYDSIIAIQLKDADGNPYQLHTLKPYDKISWSVDLMFPDATKMPSSNGGTINLRDGGWVPSSSMANIASFGSNNMTAGQWKTFTGSKLISELPWQSDQHAGNTWFIIRANVPGATDFYVDNVTVTVEKEFVPTILEVTEVDAGADNIIFNVETDGVIDIDSLADYILIDGVAVNADNVTVEAVDATNTLVTIAGLAPKTEYEISVTGALNSRDRNVTVAEGEGTIVISTIAEIDTEASIAGDTFSYSLTSNLADDESVYVVLLRCKGNTVIETTMAQNITVESGVPVEGSIDIPELENGEYYRFFVWSYMGAGAVNSMANLIDLD